MDRCTLLLVDDDSRLIEALLRSVRGLKGLHVVTATSSAAALDAAAKHRVDAAVVDLLLGTESGVELIRALRHAHPELPIAAMTGAASSAVVEAARAAGAATILPKPASLGAVAHALDLKHRELRAQQVADYPTVERLVWDYVQRVHADLGGNVVRTARVVGMTRNTVKTLLASEQPRS